MGGTSFFASLSARPFVSVAVINFVFHYYYYHHQHHHHHHRVPRDPEKILIIGNNARN
jgi:hypothetical protein